jgi:hypothetical protein
MAEGERSCYVCLPNGRIREAELHWYEAHGIGRKEFKIKRRCLHVALRDGAAERNGRRSEPASHFGTELHQIRRYARG